jgi:hypothetical protein
VRAQDLAGIWCGCKMCPFIPLMPLSFFPCTKITALDEDNYRTVDSGCCLCLPMPPVHSEYRRIYVNGSPTNAFDTWVGGRPAYRVDMAEREAAVSAGQAEVKYYRAGCSRKSSLESDSSKLPCVWSVYDAWNRSMIDPGMMKIC